MESGRRGELIPMISVEQDAAGSASFSRADIAGAWRHMGASVVGASAPAKEPRPSKTELEHAAPKVVLSPGHVGED
jgi:hypothetical protein